MSLVMWTINDVISAVNGCIVIRGVCGRAFRRINIDSRNVVSGDLFVAINGNNCKGACFVHEAVAKGAFGVLVESNDVKELDLEMVKKKNIVCITVRDTVRAIGDLAAYHRRRVNIKVVAVTGSIGKTTTRQIISNILVKKYPMISTAGNMNNLIGLPLTLLKVEDRHRVVVLELGMNNFGEIGRLAEICQPDIGIITNVAPVHLATLGNIDNIARAKGEIMEHIKSAGSIVLNVDVPLVKSLSKMTNLNVLFFGIGSKADIQGKNICITARESSFSLKTPSGCTKIRLSLPSKTMVENVLAASSAAVLLKCSNDEIKAGVELFVPNFGRMENIKTGVAGVDLIDDTYNSSPMSLKSALETVSLLKNNRFTIVVVGDMLELGRSSKSMHYEVGQFIAQIGIDRLYATGYFAKYFVKGAISANMPMNQTFFGNKRDIIEDVKQHLKVNCVVLVKGSRGMKMERIAEEIANVLNRTSIIRFESSV